MQLELRRRNWPELPLLIHDDCSPESAELEALCREYGADFISTGSRSGIWRGDMGAIVRGLGWASERRLDLLVKFSRRFLVTYRWLDELERLAHNTQALTYATPCAEGPCELRSECLAFHVDAWTRSSTFGAMKEMVDGRRQTPPSLELWYYQEALKIYNRFAPMSLRSRNFYLQMQRRAVAVAPWNIAAFSRRTETQGIVWHNANFPEDYHGLAVTLGLTDLTIDRFRWFTDQEERLAAPLPAPPTATPRLGPSAAAQTEQGRALDAAGFVRAGDLPAAKRLAASLPSTDSFSAGRYHAAISNRLSGNGFELFRALRIATSPVSPFVASRTLWDTVAISAVANKPSVRDAVAQPRHQIFARFLCRKASEDDGLILTFGSLPIGLIRQAATEYGTRLRIVSVVADPIFAVCQSGTLLVNGWRHCCVYTPGEVDWPQRLAGLEYQKISLVYVEAAGAEGAIVESLRTIMERDRPQIVVGFKDTRRVSSELERVTRALASARFRYACTRMDGDAEGVMRPFDPDRPLVREALYAWPARAADCEETGGGASSMGAN